MEEAAAAAKFYFNVSAVSLDEGRHPTAPSPARDTNPIKFMELKLICSSYSDKVKDKNAARLSLEWQIFTIKINFSSFCFLMTQENFHFLFIFLHSLAALRQKK